MHAAVIGAGPTGLYMAIALARRGHAVNVIDRDPGPQPDGSWPRRGVMQFHHPHFFRAQVIEALQTEMPDVYQKLLTAGAQPTHAPAGPDQPDELMGLRCRRMTFEHVARGAARREPGVTLRTGNAHEVSATRGRATGLRVNNGTVEADLVIDASGRTGRLSRGRRAPARSSDCGFAYVSRQYRLHPGADPGPMNAPFGHYDVYPDYQAIVFLHDNGIFSTIIARPSTNTALAGLRNAEAFDTAAHAIPALAAWTEPDRAHPITPVLPSGRLHNRYQGQLDDHGRVTLPGLVFVGDTVCTTNPVLGRGVTTSLMQAHELLRLLDTHRRDIASPALAFDQWCTTHIRPWFDDHLHADAEQVRRWTGHDIDLSRPLPSDLIAAAALADPSLLPVVGPYLAMRALPASLDTAQARVREIYAKGWRPPTPQGPTGDQLAELIAPTRLART